MDLRFKLYKTLSPDPGWWWWRSPRAGARTGGGWGRGPRARGSPPTRPRSRAGRRGARPPRRRSPGRAARAGQYEGSIAVTWPASSNQSSPARSPGPGGAWGSCWAARAEWSGASGRLVSRVPAVSCQVAGRDKSGGLLLSADLVTCHSDDCSLPFYVSEIRLLDPRGWHNWSDQQPTIHSLTLHPGDFSKSRPMLSDLVVFMCVLNN